MSTYAGKDNTTDIILDMISEHESAGNYNAVIGDANASDDLSKYDLTDIYRLMGNMLAAGEPSTAIGRYQIIHKTLLGLQESQSIADDAMFTPELQDSLAVALMVGRGYSKWWTGEMSDEDFASGLSCEWASLPDPQRGGKSHYDGDGVNSAGTTLAHVYGVLARARAAQKQQPQAVQTVASRPWWKFWG